MLHFISFISLQILFLVLSIDVVVSHWRYWNLSYKLKSWRYFYCRIIALWAVSPDLQLVWQLYYHFTGTWTFGYSNQSFLISLCFLIYFEHLCLLSSENKHWRSLPNCYQGLRLIRCYRYCWSSSSHLYHFCISKSPWETSLWHYSVITRLLFWWAPWWDLYALSFGKNPFLWISLFIIFHFSSFHMSTP